jgi:hypothetical protein
MDRKVTIGRTTKASDQNYSIKTVSGADYTILDNDKFDAIFLNPTGADRTAFLPTVADNVNRVLTLMNIGDGSYKAILDGEGTEKINNELAVNLVSGYDMARVISNGTEWKILDLHAHADSGWLLNEMAGAGSADWAIVHLGTDPTDPTDSWTHNLGVPQAKTKTILLISTDGTDANGFDIGTALYSPDAAHRKGFTIYQVDNNNLIIQTATNGLNKVDSDGGETIIVAQNWYYRIITKRILY